jgi:hypothetical protein
VTAVRTATRRLAREFALIAALAAGAWLGLAAIAPSAQACSCAEPAPFTPKVLPEEGSFVPRNTRIWLLTQTPSQPQHALGVELRDANGMLIETRANTFTFGVGGESTLVVLEPTAELPADAAFAVHVVGELDGMLRQRVSFHTNDSLDLEPPAPPSAEDVLYIAPDPGSSCGPNSSLSVALAGDAWMVKRSADPGVTDPERLHPDVPASAIEVMFPDKLEGYELSSGFCPDHAPAAKGTMQLGTFDLAGHFSGWSERLRFEPPADASPCSVSAVGLGRARAPVWPLIAAFWLAARRLRRPRI